MLESTGWAIEDRQPVLDTDQAAQTGARTMLPAQLSPVLALGAGPELTLVVSVGNVTGDSAIVWGRCSGLATLTVEARTAGAGGQVTTGPGQPKVTISLRRWS